MSDSPVPLATILLGETRIAYRHQPAPHPATGPGILFLPGLMSDSAGQKASALAAWAAARGLGFLAIDHYGHGASEGRFEDGTIGRWADDAAMILERLTKGPQILVGSSMGGWLMLLVARALPDRVAGLVGIAAAPDFTEDLMLPALTASQQGDLARDGVTLLPSNYGEGYPISAKLLAEARLHLQLRAPVPIACPVRLLHGQADPDVPWQTSLRLAECLASRDVQVTLVKDGDHRLSRPADIALLCQLVDAAISARSPSL